MLGLHGNNSENRSTFGEVIAKVKCSYSFINSQCVFKITTASHIPWQSSVDETNFIHIGLVCHKVTSVAHQRSFTLR